jgi:hypothetical protein
MQNLPTIIETLFDHDKLQDWYKFDILDNFRIITYLKIQKNYIRNDKAGAKFSILASPLHLLLSLLPCPSDLCKSHI